MIYNVGMLCKHFKGKDLLEKNIYRIIAIGISGQAIDPNIITYTGDGELANAHNLVVYANIFQNDKLFAREYEDISSELSEEKKSVFGQSHRVEPLTDEEIIIINNPNFIEEKARFTLSKFQK